MSRRSSVAGKRPSRRQSVVAQEALKVGGDKPPSGSSKAAAAKEAAVPKESFAETKKAIMLKLEAQKVYEVRMLASKRKDFQVAKQDVVKKLKELEPKIKAREKKSGSGFDKEVANFLDKYMAKNMGRG